MEDSTDGLQLTCRGIESTPDGGYHFISFDACLNLDGYSGIADFSVEVEDIVRFTADLSRMWDDEQLKPEITCGWGTDADFFLKLSRYGRLGHILAECKMSRYNYGSIRSHCSAGFVIDFAQVDAFVLFLRRVRQEPMGTFLLR